jgi:hypothetical protein
VEAGEVRIAQVKHFDQRFVRLSRTEQDVALRVAPPDEPPREQPVDHLAGGLRGQTAHERCGAARHRHAGERQPAAQMRLAFIVAGPVHTGPARMQLPATPLARAGVGPE